MNVLQQRMDDLAHTHHETLLKAVLSALTEKNPFAWRKTSGRLTLDADAVARTVMRARTWSERDLLTQSSPGAIPRASTFCMPLEEEDATRKLLHQTYRMLTEHFATLAQHRNVSPEQLARTTMGDIQQVSPFAPLDSQAQSELNNSFTATRKRLSFTKPRSGTPIRQPLMRWHKLTLTISVPPNIVQHIAEAVRVKLGSHLRLSDLDELHETIAQQAALSESDFAKLARILTTETVGQLKKEATLQYLTFLEEQMGERNEAQPYVHDLLRRLRLLQEYLRRETGDENYQISYQGVKMDLRTLLAQANAFNVLPVFPLVDGSVGETTNWDAGEQGKVEHTYTFGMKLKLNGKVTRSGNRSSFEYHLALLRREDRTHPEQVGLTPERLMLIVRTAILYHVVFSDYHNHTYDPIAALEQEVLPVLRSAADGQESIDELFARIADQCQRQQTTLLKMAAALRSVLKQTTLAPPYQREVNLSMRGGIVETKRSAILNEGHLFRQDVDLTRTDALAYLDVEAPEVSSQALFKLQARIAFEDVQCFGTADRSEACAIRYAVSGFTTLPVSLSVLPGKPNPEELTTSPDKAVKPGLEILCAVQTTRNGAHVAIHRDHPTPWFVYRYVLALMSYFGVQLLASYGPQNLFISLARIHQTSEDVGDKEDPEGFIAMLGKVLAQVLSTDYLANSQGLQQNSTPYMKHNAAASLYAPLPKVFSIPPDLPMEVLPRLALVIVSSRESDSLIRGKDNAQRRYSTVYGEVVEIQRIDQQSVRVQRAGAFSDRYSYQELYTSPTVILDQIHQLYQQGYRDILYVAQAPYSSTLHVTRRERTRAHMDPESEGLFFLSTAIIKQCVEANPNLRIYPVFRDQYHAMRIGDLGADTLYIQDLAELIRVVEDKSQQMVVFLNLFSGKIVGSAAEAKE
ncbi:MAG TPA: hypothetical protein VFV38_25160, partial [Ktedonobacteraceae bacterium]|nr:hypothetical protein [Ktedonobacteraceae bacterium]